MSRTTLTKLAIPAARSALVRSINRSSRPIASIFNNGPSKLSPYTVRTARAFSATVARPLGLSPESEEPPAKTASPETETTEYNVGGKPADLTPETYHELSDKYLNVLVDKMEQMQEDNKDVDCEFSVCCPLSSLHDQMSSLTHYIDPIALKFTNTNVCNLGWCLDFGLPTQWDLYFE